MKFAIQSGYQDRGVAAVRSVAPTRICKLPQIEEGETPLGSVEWTEKVLGRTVTPCYFPDFLAEYFHRNIFYSETWPLGRRCFIKPAKRHKAWKAKIYNGRGYKGKKPGSYIISDVVRFRNEYRYYVANGKVLSGWWYWGDSTDTEQRHEGTEIPEAPSLDSLNIPWPEGFCGAVDFGELWDTDELAVIENNAPFACGWYGERENSNDYAEFLAAGWLWLLAEKDREVCLFGTIF